MDITIAGSTVIPGVNPDQLGRINIELAAFDGEIGTGQFPVPDPSGSDFVASGRQLMVEQGAALLSNGFIIDQDWQRGPFRVATEREYDYSIQDANALLSGFRVIRKRPAETDYTRVMAFAARDGSSWDTTWVLNSSTVTMPAKTYDGDEGWAELITDVVEFTGKTLFLHDKAAGGRCLHYHLLTTGHTCGLTITDDPSALNATHYAPIGALRQSTSIDLRNDVEGRDQAGRKAIIRDATSIAVHNADGLKHQALVDFSASSQADLNVKTAAYVASSKNEYHTYSCSIGPLNGTALALIRVGDIITVTSRAMGLSASNQRIAHMALSPWNGRPELWLARLELGAPVRRRARVRQSIRGTVGGGTGEGTATQNFDAVTAFGSNIVDIDDFENRAISPHIVPGFTDADVEGAWGEASSLRTWREVTYTSDDAFGVQSGLGRWQNDYPATTTLGDLQIELIDWDVDKYWYPEEIGGEGVLYVRFRFSTVGTVLNDGDLLFTLINSHNAFGKTWTINVITATDTGLIQFTGGTSLAKLDWVANTWYILEVHQQGTIVEARVYAESGSIPSYQVSQTVSQLPWDHNIDDGDYLSWGVTGFDVLAQAWVDTDRIWFAASGVPVSGQLVINDIPPEAPNGLRTTFSVYGHGPIKDSSLRVRVNGIDWTGQLASIDAFAGTYTFVHAPHTGDEIVAEWMYP